jgi:hypothetical protein
VGYASICEELACLIALHAGHRHFEGQEEAIGFYKEAVDAIDQNSAPVLVAQCHVGLAQIYTKRRQGHYTENVQVAWQHLNRALSVLDRQMDLVLWLKIHLEMGLLARDSHPAAPEEAATLENDHFAKAFDFDARRNPELYQNMVETRRVWEQARALRAQLEEHKSSSRDGDGEA